MIQVEAQLLRDAKAWNETFEMLTQGGERASRIPSSSSTTARWPPRASTASTCSRADLRRVIQMKPDYAHAYNALGYTLAEKTDRLAEAKDADREGVQARARRPVHPGQPGLGATTAWATSTEALEAPAARLRAAARSRDRRAPGRSAVDERASATRRRRSGAPRSPRTPNNETLLAVMQKYRP